MIIDAHGHVTAPNELYAYKAGLLAARSYHGRGNPAIDDAKLEAALTKHLQILQDNGTDMQFISPRPYQQMHSEKPEAIVHWWIQANNDVIARQVRAHPDVFRGVAGLPQNAGVSPRNSLEELERCVKELGFVGCLVNPDPGEGDGQTPPMGDEYWYPLYEKLVELDVPALVHSAGCKSHRESYSGHFITEESIAILSILDSRVMQDFPALKLVFSHGGGSVPYQVGRWRAWRWRNRADVESFDTSLRRLYFDTVLYNKESLELLFKVVGPDRCLFGTEAPGSGATIDPATGRAMDDLKPVIESIDWLTDEQRSLVFGETAARLYKLDSAQVAG